MRGALQKHLYRAQYLQEAKYNECLYTGSMFSSTAIGLVEALSCMHAAIAPKSMHDDFRIHPPPHEWRPTTESACKRIQRRWLPNMLSRCRGRR